MVNVEKPEELFSEVKFNEYCNENKLKFPGEYVEFLKEFNDGELDANEVDGFDECSVRYFFGTTSEEFSNLSDVFSCLADRMPKGCVPIAEAEGGNLLCISIEDNTYGKIYFWDHETMDVEDSELCKYQIRDMPLIANSFSELLSKIKPL